MKKLLLGLGSIASVVAPVAAVISCGDDSITITPGTNGTQGTGGTQGTEGHTVTISDNTVVQAVGAGLNAALGLTATNVGAVVAGDNLNLSLGTTGTKSLNFAHYTKVTFTANDTIQTGISGSATVAVTAGDSLVIGMPAPHRRAAAADLKVVLMGANGTNMEVKVDTAKLTQLKTQVVDKVVEHVEAQNPDSGNGGSGSTGGATPTHKTVDFTGPATGHATSQKWHEALTVVDVNGNRTFHMNLVEGDIITATVNGQLHSHTLSAGEISALAALNVQDDAVNKIAELIAQDTTNGAVSPDDVKAAFKLDTTGHHSFTATVSGGSGSVGTPSTAGITIDLGASTGADFAGGKITWTTLWTKIHTAIGTNHPANIVLRVDTKDLTIALTAWTQKDIKDALTAALSGATGFTGCFDTAK